MKDTGNMKEIISKCVDMESKKQTMERILELKKKLSVT